MDTVALYRAINLVEIAAGNILVPKSTEPFVAELRVPFIVGSETIVGPRPEHAIRDHQLDGKYPTRGVSCTTSLEVARRYAARHRVIVRINEAACDAAGIDRFRVRDHVPRAFILQMEDEETILVANVDGPLPREIVAEVIRLQDNGPELQG